MVFNQIVCSVSVTLEPSTMKIFSILLIICVSTASSIDLGFQNFVNGIFCNIGSFTGAAAANVSSACSKLPGNNNTFVNAVNTAFIQACTSAAGTVGDVSKRFTKYCPDGSTVTSAAPISQGNSTPTPTQSTSTSAPTTESTTTPAPTTQSTSTPAPTTPSTTTQAATTTEEPYRPCTDMEHQSCNKYCQNAFDYDINFGEHCKGVIGSKAHRCHCETIQNCEKYTNATCKEQCNNKPICRYPEKDYPCVCIYGTKQKPLYRLPNSKYVREERVRG